MKPIKISFQCFGPYPGKVDIDLNDVSREGLFLICGDTGAGKTTLLDAMCYALYYSSASGAANDNGKGDFSSMRSTFAKPSDKNSTFVELELENNGTRYRIRRELAPKKRAAGFDEKHSLDKWENGSWKPVMANPKQKNVTEAAVKLVGLTADQFRQIIILPQGRFEQFLTSDTESKENILSTLFGAEHWKTAVENLKNRAKTQADAIKLEHSNILTILHGFNCTDTDALGELEAQLKTRIPELETAQSKASLEFTQASEQLTDAAVVDGQFKELEDREKEIRKLEKAEEAIAQSRVRLDAAKKADALRPGFNDVQRIRQEAVKAANAEKTKKKILEEQSGLLEHAQESWDAHEKKRSDIEAAKNRLVILKNSEDAYENYEMYRQNVAELVRKEETALQKKNIAAKNKEKADEKLIAATAKSKHERDEFDRVQRLYVLGTAGRLAQGLAEGEPCPVCGSLHHPQPAQTDAVPVTDEALKTAEDAMKAANNEFDQAFEKQRDAASKAETATRDYDIAHGDTQKAAALLDQAKKQLIEGIESKEQLASEISLKQKQIKGFESDDTELQKQLTAAQNAYHIAKGSYDEAQKTSAECSRSLKDKECQWMQLLEEKGYADETEFKFGLMEAADLEKLRKDIEKHDADFRHARDEYDKQLESTQGKTRPDMSELRKTMQTAKLNSEKTAADLQNASQQLEEMHKTLHELLQREDKLRNSENEWNRLNSFVVRLLNSNGMNLHRYLLAAMLSLVIEQANLLLENVHGGRYRLQRSNDAAGNQHKTGLEFNVEDTCTNSVRSVKSLSGGEKFLVSLALAIGLNTVLQSQSHGIRVEAIFVDEGFGSLDTDSVNDAMQILQIVRRSHGMVGVISHIDALRNEIPIHIEAHKDTNHGSTLTY